MKKIYYIVSLAVLALFTSCDYNGSNFPGYDQAAIPTNVASYNYTLTDADYSTISKAALKIAVTKKDSTKANSIASNKFFSDTIPAGTYIPLLLNTKYLYADANSSASISFNQSYDTTKIAVANKYTLVTADYASMGTTASLPGQYNNFTATIDPNYYIPIFLKKTYPYAIKGDIKLIRYKYYASSVTTQIATVFVFDGSNWVNYNKTNQVSKSFVYRGGKWLDLLIFKGLTSGLGNFNAISVTGAQAWVWVNTYGAKMSGYSGGNLDNEDWLISPQIDLAGRVLASLTFSHTGKYFGTKTTEATLWLSENYTSGNPSTAIWTQITIPNYWTTDFTFISSGKIDLKSYVGKKINIAFKYLSSPAAAGTWEIQNVTITEE